MKINHRAYRGEADNQLIRDLLSQNYAVTRHPYYTADPPNWERVCTAVQTGSNKQIIQLWELAGRPEPPLIGFVLYRKQQGAFSSLAHPHYRGIEDAMVAWVEGEHRATITKQSEKKPLKCSVCEGNQAQKAILVERGYVRSHLGAVFRRRTLDTAVPETNLPQGYRIYEINALSEAQFAARARAESAVFGSVVTVAFLQRLQSTPIYRPELDLAAVDGDGRVAAFCALWFDKKHRAGYFEPIGTVPAHRRRGLGKA
ncbi:MAG: GNAT family N-acetyltransferase, partial [Chloroflexi bacterium]|nr:GNAT family N-acetyltransferase [Chloroflexota bacterium]